MRVAIDTTPLKSDHKLRGIGSYTEQLVKALQRYENKHSYHFFTRGQIIPKNVDLVHYPYFDPFLLTLPFIKSKPTVVTVHDLIPIAFPEHFPKGFRGELKWQIQKTSLNQARRIITDSNASKKDVNRLIGFAEDRIDVVYLAPSITHWEWSNIRLPKRYILYVGDVNWNKNIPGLLEAFSIVKKNISNRKLVLVGKQFLNTSLRETQNINKRISELDINPDVVKLGFVKNEDLPTVYRRAAVYVQPSFAEGFGLPVLEAMAYGCPVVCTNTSSLVEIAGPSIIVNSDSKDIAHGIVKSLTMSNVKRQLATKSGILWAKRFTWKKVAKETVAVYEKALD